MTAAGLVYDAATLTSFGIGITGLVLVLYIWNWSRSPAAIQPLNLVTLRSDAPNSELSDQDKILFLLERARDNARIAQSIKGSKRNHYARQVYNESVAAVNAARKCFGLSGVTFKGRSHIPYEDALDAYIEYVDIVLPRLQAGQIEEARKKVEGITWTWRVVD